MTPTSRSRPREIAIQMSGLVTLFLSDKISEEDLAARLRNLAERIEGTKVLQPKRQSPYRTVDEEGRIFEYWKKRMGKTRSIFGSGRREKVRARLREGRTEAEIKQAIDACSASEFHMGENDRNQQYNDLTLICRSAEQLEKFLEMRGTQDHSHKQAPALTRLQEEAAEALQKGDMDAYNSANARIRDAQRS